MVKANVAQVNIGPFVIDGLMDEIGDYFVAMPQMVDMNLIPPNRSLKQLQSLVGEGFQSHRAVKLKTPLHPKEINAIPLELFEGLVVELTIKGNQSAISLTRALVGLSLHQLFCDSFGIKFEKEDRQRWLSVRFKTKHDFRWLTDKLQEYGFKEPWEYANYISRMQEKIGVKNGTRDFLEFEILQRLDHCQTCLTAYMDCGLSPFEALDKLKVEIL